VSLSDTAHIQSACANAETLVDFDQDQMWTFVGEWTPAMTDCAKYLNGRGVGSRYDGSYNTSVPGYGSCAEKTGLGSTFTQKYKDFLRMTWEAQVSLLWEAVSGLCSFGWLIAMRLLFFKKVITFEKASGWVMWTWKTEGADEWSYSAGLKYGWIPQDPTGRKYSTICG
jgi:aryl-phospho-beta-D-glucosidase BglC (GH1 family)